LQVINGLFGIFMFLYAKRKWVKINPAFLVLKHLADSLLRTTVAFVGGRVALIFIVAPVNDDLMLRAVRPIRQLRAAGVAAGALWLVRTTPPRLG